MEYTSAAKQALLDPRAAQTALYGALIFAPLYVFVLRPFLHYLCATLSTGKGRLQMPDMCSHMSSWSCAGCLSAPLHLMWAVFYRVFLCVAGKVLSICHAVIRASKAACRQVKQVRSALEQRHARIIEERMAWSKADAAKVVKKYGALHAASTDEESEEEVPEEEVVAPRRKGVSPRASVGSTSAPRRSGTTHDDEVTLAEELEEALDDEEEEVRQENRLSGNLEVRGTKAVLHPAPAAARLRRRDAPARWVQSLKRSYDATQFGTSRPVLSLDGHVRHLFAQFRRQAIYRERNITEASLEALYGRPAFQKWYVDSREDLLEEVRLRRHFVLWHSVFALVMVVITLTVLPAFSFTNKAKVTLWSAAPKGAEAAAAATFSQLLASRLSFLQSATVTDRVPAWCASRCPATAALIGTALLCAENLLLVGAVLAAITAAFMPRRAQATATVAVMAFAVIAVEAAQATETGRVKLGMGFLLGFALVAGAIAKAMN